MNAIITAVKAEEILDSRGNPTLAVTVTAGEAQGMFSVPSGASTGSHEALELRDGDPEHFRGLGVLKAVANVNDVIAPALNGMDAADQKAVDQKLLELDGTPNKSRLGANAVIGASIACAKAAAAARNIPVYEHLRTLATMKPSRSVPLLFMNLVNGGKHAQSRLAFQEYHIVPQTESIEEALEMGTSVMQELRKLIVKDLGAPSANIGDEGGFAVDTDDVSLPLELLVQAIGTAGYGPKIKLALDVAASSFFKDETYAFQGRSLSPQEFLAYYRDLIKNFPIISIEDPFAEEAFADFAALNDGSVLVVGDDLTVTNKERLQAAIDQKAVSGVIIKPNQIGTLTETLDAMRLARDNGVECIVSHRSGETNDDFIADLAYAFGAYGLKSGAPQREERVIKYNRLWEIIK